MYMVSIVCIHTSHGGGGGGGRGGSACDVMCTFGEHVWKEL